MPGSLIQSLAEKHLGEQKKVEALILNVAALGFIMDLDEVLLSTFAPTQFLEPSPPTPF